MGGFNIRLGTYNVPAGPSANPYGEAPSAEFTNVWAADYLFTVYLRDGKCTKVSQKFTKVCLRLLQGVSQMLT